MASSGGPAPRLGANPSTSSARDRFITARFCHVHLNTLSQTRTGLDDAAAASPSTARARVDTHPRGVIDALSLVPEGWGHSRRRGRVACDRAASAPRVRVALCALVDTFAACTRGLHLRA